jgi:hypothetical protein
MPVTPIGRRQALSNRATHVGRQQARSTAAAAERRPGENMVHCRASSLYFKISRLAQRVCCAAPIVPILLCNRLCRHRLASGPATNQMERALQAIILSREPRFRAMETPMPRRASSFSPILPGVVCVLLAAAAPGLVSSAQAECITQPNQQAPDGAHWSLHFDPVKNRRCWVLVDSASGEPPAPEPQPAAPSGLSSLQSFLSNITGSPSAQPLEAPASPTAAPPRKLQPRVARPSVANVNGTDHPVRTEQKADAQPARHEMTRGERDALFEEFLRWRESKKVTGPANPR